MVKTKISQKAEVHCWTSALFYVERKTFTGQQYIVKRIKEIANRIILQKHSQSYAWRIDVALFFERYVQWIFEQTAKLIGGEMFCNPKYAGHGANFDWLLHYLEPDIVLKFAETQIIVDAKYKSYLYHKHTKSNTLRESYRNDLHQLLAYTAFSTEKKKHCVLVAPFTRFEVSYPIPFSVFRRNNRNILSWHPFFCQLVI